jgi:hypothetical protein
MNRRAFLALLGAAPLAAMAPWSPVSHLRQYLPFLNPLDGSYVSVAECDAYVASRLVFDPESGLGLHPAEWRVSAICDQFPDLLPSHAAALARLS